MQNEHIGLLYVVWTQMCNIIFLLLTCELKHSFVWLPSVFFFTYVNKKTTCGPTNVQYQKKSPIWIFLNHLCTHKRELSFLTILFFPFTYVGKKNHLWAHKCAIPFFPSPMWEKKPLVSSQVCNTIFSFTYVRKKNHQRAH
jgi:hypothetical protein